MLKKGIITLAVLGIIVLLAYPASARKINKEETQIPYDKGDTIEIKVYIEVEDENETGEYMLEIEEKDGFQWVDGNNVSVTIDTVGEGRWLVIKVTAEDPADGKYIFNYHVFKVNNGTEVEVASDNFEVEIGLGDGDACGAVFLALPIFGLLALVAFVKRE